MVEKYVDVATCAWFKSKIFKFGNYWIVRQRWIVKFWTENTFVRLFDKHAVDVVLCGL